MNFQETKLICCFSLISADTSQRESGLDSNSFLYRLLLTSGESQLWGKHFSFVRTRKHKQVINQSFIKMPHSHSEFRKCFEQLKYTVYFFSFLMKDCHYRCCSAHKTQPKLQKQQRQSPSLKRPSCRISTYQTVCSRPLCLSRQPASSLLKSRFTWARASFVFILCVFIFVSSSQFSFELPLYLLIFCAVVLICIQQELLLMG